MTSRTACCTPWSSNCIDQDCDSSFSFRSHWKHMTSNTFSLEDFYPSMGISLASWNSHPMSSHQIPPILSISSGFMPVCDRQHRTLQLLDSLSQRWVHCHQTNATGASYTFLSNHKVALPQALSPVLSPVRKILKSTCNVFGLFQQYHTTGFPDHNPNENIVSDDLIDSSPNTLWVETYHPYPNQSSFLLGEWYWNDGVQKSQSSFQNLLNIVGQSFDQRMLQVWIGSQLMLSLVEISKLTAWMMRGVGRMNKWMATGSKRQSRLRFHFTSVCCIQARKCLTPEIFIIVSWCLWLGRRLQGHPPTHSSISNHTDYIGNQRNPLNRSEFTENCTPPRHLSRLTTNFKEPSESQDVILQGL